MMGQSVWLTPFFRMMIVYLTGFMASGKSSCLRIIRDTLSLPVFDLDEQLEQRVGMSIPQYVLLHGWDAFRILETDVLIKSRELYPQHVSDSAVTAVFACGGGVVLAEENRRFLAEPGNTVIWLNTALEVIMQRLEGVERPLLAGMSREEVKDLHRQRVPLYQATADFTVTDDDSLLGLLSRLASKL